jgi:prepilin-type N-terminal cleavage/methylation domain-containing protein
MIYNTKQKGFTLIEMIVSLAIFTVVAVVAVGALLKIMDANKKSINLKTAINNMNFVLESMTREIRVGTKYYYSPNVNSSVTNSYSTTDSGGLTSGSPWLIAFTSSERGTGCNLIYAYRYNGTRLQKAVQSGCGNDVVNSDYIDLSDPNVRIVSSKVNVSNTGQPMITILLKGEVGVRNKDKTEFTIQSRVTQRIK